MSPRTVFRLKSSTAAAPLALLACLALALGGCSAGPAPEASPTGSVITPGPRTEGPVTHFTPAPAALQGKVDCLANAGWLLHGDAPTAAVEKSMGSLPAGFVPVEAVKCSGFSEPPSDATTPSPMEILQEQLTGDFTALLAALAEPSDRQDGIACMAMLEITPDLWLVDSTGKAIHVKWPKDACNFSKPGTAKALDALTVSSRTKLKALATP